MSALPDEYMAGAVAAQQEPAPRPELTSREVDLVRGVVSGLTNAQIATQLGLREQTVRNRLCRVFQKVGVSNRLQLALEAIRYGLVPDAKAGV